MPYACTAATAGKARCRNLVGEDGRFCSLHNHDSDVPTAPPPVTVLYKFSINESWRQKFMALGVLLKQPNFAKKEAKHVAHAEAHGRDAFRYRQVADSGVPVFGPDGLQMVSLAELVKELAEKFKVVDIHILPKLPKPGQSVNPMSMLVVSFSHEGQTVNNEKAFWLLMDLLNASCWGKVHVWANPPQEDGRVVHTVNSAHREENHDPQRVLRFAEGLWSEEQVAPKA